MANRSGPHSSLPRVLVPRHRQSGLAGDDFTHMPAGALPQHPDLLGQRLVAGRQRGELIDQPTQLGHHRVERYQRH